MRIRITIEYDPDPIPGADPQAVLAAEMVYWGKGNISVEDIAVCAEAAPDMASVKWEVIG